MKFNKRLSKKRLSLNKFKDIKKKISYALAPFLIGAFILGGSWSAYAKETKGNQRLGGKPPVVDTIQQKDNNAKDKETKEIQTIDVNKLSKAIKNYKKSKRKKSKARYTSPIKKTDGGYRIIADRSKGTSGISFMVKVAVQRWAKDNKIKLSRSEKDYLMRNLTFHVVSVINKELIGEKFKKGETKEVNAKGDGFSGRFLVYSFKGGLPLIRKGSVLEMSSDLIKKYYEDTKSTFQKKNVLSYAFAYKNENNPRFIYRTISRAIKEELKRNPSLAKRLKVSRGERSSIAKELTKETFKEVNKRLKKIKEKGKESDFIDFVGDEKTFGLFSEFTIPAFKGIFFVGFTWIREKEKGIHRWRDAYIRSSSFSKVIENALEKVRKKKKNLLGGSEDLIPPLAPLPPKNEKTDSSKDKKKTKKKKSNKEVNANEGKEKPETSAKGFTTKKKKPVFRPRPVTPQMVKPIQVDVPLNYPSTPAIPGKKDGKR